MRRNLAIVGLVLTLSVGSVSSTPVGATTNPHSLAHWVKGRGGRSVTVLLHDLLRQEKSATAAHCAAILHWVHAAKREPKPPGKAGKAWRAILRDFRKGGCRTTASSVALWTQAGRKLDTLIADIITVNLTFGLHEYKILKDIIAVSQSTSSTSGPSSRATTTTVPPPPPSTTTTAPCESIPYNQLVRDPTSLSGQCVVYEAKVFQYTSRTGLTEMLVEVTRGTFTTWTGIVEVNVGSVNVSSVYQTDIVQLVGVVTGSFTYTTAAGGSNTVPSITLKSISVLQSAG